MSVIFAPITGRGGAVTVLRLSGEGAFEIVATLLQPVMPANAGIHVFLSSLKPRRAALRTLRFQDRVLDRAVVTLFPAPQSFTGEDCAELSLHGGRAVLAAVSAALVAQGARPAEPGEFSRRAFLNGKMDLLEAEAMDDLIAAETEAQRRLAVEGADAMHTACAAWREALRQIMAEQEALIDFPDEDLPPEVEAGMVARIAALRSAILALLDAAPAAERLREGLEFVILGAPNAGKSTLLNALAGEEVAIVSETPGTTRDALGVRVDLGGVPVRLTDTAGLRESADPIEAEGVRRAQARAAGADLVIAVAPPGAAFPPVPDGLASLFVRTKSDLPPPRYCERSEAIHLFAPHAAQELPVSALTGEGMPQLRAALAQAAADLTDLKGITALARPRQVACVRDTADALGRALARTEPELRGEELRAAAHALSRLTGLIGVEEILDAVFSGFCIGK